MLNRRRSSTRILTGGELVLSDSRRPIRLLVALLILILFVLVIGLAVIVRVEAPLQVSVATLEPVTSSLADTDTNADEEVFVQQPAGEVGLAAIAALEEQNAQLLLRIHALQDALSAAALDLEVERATRTELELQLSGLREHLMQIQEELAFLKSAGNSAPKP